MLCCGDGRGGTKLALRVVGKASLARGPECNMLVVFIVWDHLDPLGSLGVRYIWISNFGRNTNAATSFRTKIQIVDTATSPQKGFTILYSWGNNEYTHQFTSRDSCLPTHSSTLCHQQMCCCDSVDCIQCEIVERELKN